MPEQHAYGLPGVHAPDTDTDPWRIVRDPDQANGHVNFTEHEVSVPPAHVTEGTDAIRLHEIRGHGKYTHPAAPGGVAEPRSDTFGWFQKMGEEVRVDALLREQDAIDVSHRHDDTDWDQLWRELDSPRPDGTTGGADPKMLMFLFLQFWPTRHTGARDTFTQILDRLGGVPARPRPGSLIIDALTLACGSIEAAARDPDGPRQSGLVRDHWAKTLAAWFEEDITVPTPGLTAAVTEAIKAQLAAEKADDGDLAGPGSGVTGMGGDRRPRTDTPPATVPESAGAAGITTGHGTMQICDHTMPGLKTMLIKTPNGATDQGTDIRHIHRYAEDQAIFRHRRPGGAVLIDCSGSMHWPLAQLQLALKDLPSTTIALYQGLFGPTYLARYTATTGRKAIPYPTAAEIDKLVTKYRRGSRYEGRLCIIAKQGRIAPLVKEDDLMGGNDVDYEALCWLAHQPGPRVWLSDGQVCGGYVEWTHGRGTLASLCQQVLDRNQIWRTTSVPDAIAYLKRGIGRAGRIPDRVLATSKAGKGGRS